MNDEHRDEFRQDDRRRLDDPRNVTRIVYGLAVLCLLALVADFFYAKHPYFSVEHWPGFYALYGFTGSVGLVLTAKGLRRWLRRDEDYYEPPERDEGVEELPGRNRDDD
ncbi:hypothetical protein ACFYO0_34495 [Streptomyces sp. NPDC006365]|uniref:hypothetical protein n=1 Tax=Streptomyces sp. NPDC006365 TaxID=3364744 RepID=UPI0036A7D33C